MRIADIRIDFPVVLAALAGYSDLAYRLVCRKLGAPYCATEMMLDKMLLVEGKLRRRLLKITDADHPIAGQLIGNDPATMATAAGRLCELGFDVVDLNFACPVNKAMRRRRGGFLMSQPELTLEIIRAVVSASDRPVTLKLRRSFREDDKTNDAFWRIAEGAFDAGVEAVCVHGRSVEAKYGPPADWGFLASVKKHFADRTIIGSGDVLVPADALRMLAETGVDAVAVARGVLGNPWFFMQVRDILAGRPPHRPTIAEQRELLLAHFHDACRLYGEVRGPKIMRKFGIRYARVHPTPKPLRAAFVQVKHPRQWHDVIDEFYGDQCVSLL